MKAQGQEEGTLSPEETSWIMARTECPAGDKEQLYSVSIYSFQV